MLCFSLCFVCVGNFHWLLVYVVCYAGDVFDYGV